MHACIRTYIHTYIHTKIQTNKPAFAGSNGDSKGKGILNLFNY